MGQHRRKPVLCGRKQIGGTGTGGDQVSHVTLDATGNIYITGTFSGTADFDPGVGIYNLSAVPTSSGDEGNDGYICKLDASGNFVWAKQFGGVSYVDIRSVAVDAAGNIYTAGIFTDTTDFDPGPEIFQFTVLGMWDQDIFISKLDASGNFVWAKHFGTEVTDQVSGMAVDSAGNVYTVGGFYLTEDFDPGTAVFSLSPFGGDYDADIFLSKLNTSGNFVWVKQLGGMDYDQAGAITLDKSGNIYITGEFTGTADFDPGAGVDTITAFGGTDARNIFISELDNNGNFIWAKNMGGQGYDQPAQIAVFTNGDIYTAGTFSDSADFDPGPGKYILASQGADNNDMYVSKLHPTGIFEWAMQMGGPGYDQITSLALDGFSNVYIGGGFQQTADFNPRSGVYNLTAAGDVYDQDAFVAKLDVNGFLVWAGKVGGVNYDQSNGITLDAYGNMLVVGQFGNTADFDPGIDEYNLSAFGGETDNDGFILKLHNSNVGIDDQLKERNAEQFQIYPNPCNGQFRLTMNLKSDQKLKMDIINVMGQVMKSVDFPEWHMGDNSIIIDESALPNGIYFVKVYNENSSSTMKISINK